MARSARVTRSNRQDEGTKQRGLSDQPTPFVGLALAPFIALVASWGIHYLIAGVTIGNRVLLTGSPSFLAVAISLVTLAAVALATAAWYFGKGRDIVYRATLTGSVFVITEWIAVLIGVGPHRWWGTFFVLITWGVATMWALPRLHVLRRDPSEGRNDREPEGDDLISQLGLTGYRTKGDPEVRYDDKGEPERIIVDIKHRFGATKDALVSALPNIESAVGGPEGLSRVTKPEDGKSNHSILTVMLRDPLTGRVPYRGPSAPGQPIQGYSIIGRYDDGDPFRLMPFGGVDTDGISLPPTGYAFMGMTRAGKTVGENRLLLDGVITRHGGVILYLNKAKGGQDVQPIIAGVECAVLSDNNADYRTAFNQVKAILTYRQKELARYGISAWSYAKCVANPPQQTLDGTARPMAPMPMLIVHVGEADAILETAGEEAVYLASKGLSVGIVAGWSMQRFSATSMPTDLRMNIGTRLCYGVGDDYSAGFALSDDTIKRGAHPENWRNTKPGRFYGEGAGIPENRWPISAKTIGDTDDDALYLHMRQEAEQYGPNMMRLDSGSVHATRGWWTKHVTETETLRTELTPRSVPTPAPTPTPAATPAAETTQEDPMGRRPATASAAAFQVDNHPAAFDPDAADLATDTAAEIAETTEIGGQQILGDIIQPDEFDPQFAELSSIDPQAPIVMPTGDDGIDLTGPKPDPQTREEAELAFDEALRTLASDERFVDEDDNRYVTFRTGQLQEFYRYRTRQWYSPILAAMADGQRSCPPGYHIERHPERTGDGWYRMNRVPDQQF
jgi:hypothetical protein